MTKLKNVDIIESYGFRYSTTLRLNFSKPVGIGSFGFETEEQMKSFYDKFCDKSLYDFNTLIFYNKKFDKVCDLIITSLQKCKCEENEKIELDFRDDLELEVHGIDQNKFQKEIIDELNSKLKSISDS